MTSPHGSPEANGHRFGTVLVTVDTTAGDCVVHVPGGHGVGTPTRRMRLNSLDEIQGAYAVQYGLSATDPSAGDIASALKFAGERIRQREGRK